MKVTGRYLNNNQAASLVRGGVAVVIDVLRAYTTAATALAAGAERIILTADIDEALDLKALIPGAFAMKDSVPVEGFELSNSPVELHDHDLAGRTLVQRTTAGTVGAVAARHADRLYCAAFVNAAATVEAVRASGVQEVTFVVTGDDGTADEDRACAEYIAALLGTAPDAEVDAAPYLARVADSESAHRNADRLAKGVWGHHALDLQAAMSLNRFDFVLQAREEVVAKGLSALVLRAYNRSSD